VDNFSDFRTFSGFLRGAARQLRKHFHIRSRSYFRQSRRRETGCGQVLRTVMHCLFYFYSSQKKRAPSKRKSASAPIQKSRSAG
jgi:hypothetical protein